MARVNVFLSADLLKAVDEEVRRSRVKRSALIQAALTAHLEACRRAREAAETQRRIDAACRSMDDLAEKLGAWDPVGIIRAFRDTRARYAAPGRARRRTRAAR